MDTGQRDAVMQDFVRGSNLDLFTDRLAQAQDDGERRKLLKLLVEEEDRFAQDSQFHTILERHIAAGEQRIKSQRALVATLKQNGRDTQTAEFLLVTLLTTQALFMRQRHQIGRRL